MNNKLMNRIFASLAFLIALATYLMTVQPNVPFWDCGEFSAASTWQQVPHPPGAPLFLMVGRLFQLIIPFGDLGWKVNLVSVFASAATILLLYLVTVMVIKNLRKDKIETMGDMLAVYGSALVGALAFTFSDTFWFNAVESEVYASSSLFVAIIVYLMMRWNEEADKPGHEKYLLLIAYIIGLSTGVHLLSVLTIFSLVMLVYFRKYEFKFKSFMIMGVIAVITYFIIYPVIVKWVPAVLAGNSPFKNDAGEYLIEGSFFVTLIGVAIIILAGFGFWYGRKNNRQVLQLGTLAFLLVIFGYSTYTQILLRSNANPPMNENEPKNFKILTSYLGREQYGEQRMWPRRTDYNDDLKVYYYNIKNENGEYRYGEWAPPSTERARKKDGTEVGVPKWDNVNVGGELAYMWDYQIDRMYFRYLFWNFVGRESDVQDAEDAFVGDKERIEVMNFNSGYAGLFPVRFWAIPLLFGLIGLYFHARKDPKMAMVYFAMFLVMGVLAAIVQNQQEPQPRERDYFYAGSFMVYCLWIGLGTYGIIEWLAKSRKSALVPSVVVAVSILAVPINMAAGGWKMHSRAGNFIPFDYSYNILQSTDKDAILFTNGDNDTFPLWYLQDVEGVRRDVRVVNLSLGQTLWYIDQLKNRQPWGAKKIPLTFSDESLRVDENDERALTYEVGEAREVSLPIKREILEKFTNDQALINDGNMRFTFAGRQLGEQNGKPVFLFGVNNKLILDILKVTKFERPVYFSTTVGPDVFSGLQKFLRYEGMVMRICPVPASQTKTGMIDSDIMGKCLLNVDNSDNYHKEPSYGFKFRNLNNPAVYYDEVHRRLMQNYRQLFMNYAANAIEKTKDNALAVRIIDVMNKNISPVQFPMYYDENTHVALLYNESGAKEKAKIYARMTIEQCTKIFGNKKLRTGRTDNLLEEAKGSQGTYKSSAQAYLILGQYDSARGRLAELYSLCKQVASMSGQMGEGDMQAVQRNIYDVFGMLANVDEQEIKAIESQGNKQQALARAREIQKGYAESGDNMLQSLAQFMNDRINRMEGKAPIVDSSRGVPVKR